MIPNIGIYPINIRIPIEHNSEKLAGKRKDVKGAGNI